jgi:hypothetical protein
MKQAYLFPVFIAVILTACNTVQKKQAEIKIKGQPAIEFEAMSHDFDTMAFKEDASFQFRFTNVGDQPLIINKVTTSCGCTVSKYSKKPHPSGSSGTIEVEYDTQRIGRFSKSVSVYTNAQENPIVLRIKGYVKG